MRNLTSTEQLDLAGLAVVLIDPATGEMHKHTPADNIKTEVLWTDVATAPTATGNAPGPRFEMTSSGAKYFIDSEGRAEKLDTQIDVNLAPITYVPTATGNTANLGQVVVDPVGVIWVIDEAGDAIKMTMPVFKEQNRFYADPNGLDTNTGANESPKLTAQAAVTALGQGDVAVLNEGVYAAVTMNTQNTGLVGASGAYSSLSQIAAVTVATASGTSNRISDLTITGTLERTGNTPLYLNSVTVSGNTTIAGTAYVEIRDSSLQDGTITLSAASTLYVEDSKLGASTFSTAGSVVSLRNVTIDAGDCVTIGAGVVYSLQDVTGCVVIDPAAVSVEAAAAAAGLTAPLAEDAVTANFMKLAMHTPDEQTDPVQVVTRDPATGNLEVADVADLVQTKTTSLVPMVYDAGWVPAQADIEGNLAKVFELSDGTYVHDGLVTFTGHGFTVGETYYLSQATPGAFVTPDPDTGLVQQMFHVVDADTLALDIEEGWAYTNVIAPPVTEFAQTVYFNALDPADATIFDIVNPPVTNNPALAGDSSNLYISSIDASTWTHNDDTGIYSTYTYPESTPRGFSASLPTSFVVPNNVPTLLTGYLTRENTTNGGWNPVTGVYTAQRTGWHNVSGNLLYGLSNYVANSQMSMALLKNGQAILANFQFREVAGTSVYSDAVIGTANTYLRVGDTLQMRAYQTSGSSKSPLTPAYEIFSVVEIL